MKYKVAKSSIQGKGLFAKEFIRKGENIGIAHTIKKIGKDKYKTTPTSIIGKFHNHNEENPNALNVLNEDKRYLIAQKDIYPGEEITTNYRLQPELEQPEDFKKGGSVGLPKMPKPSKKGVLAKGYSRSLEATNRLFTEHYLFEKPKSKKRKVFDPNANYQDGGSPFKTELSPEDEIQFQKFYTSLPENLQQDDPSYDIRGYWDSEGKPEEFDYSQPKEDDGYYHAYSINGNTGEYLKSPWHSTFQHAVDEDRKIGYRPIVNVKGEVIAVENPALQDEYIETDLTPEEIQAYKDGGYIVEEVDESKYQDGGVYTHPARPGAKYLKREDGWYIQPPGKSGYVKIQDPTGGRTNELNKSAVLTDEVYALSPEQSKYLNAVPIKKEIAQSTDTHGVRSLTKAIEENKIRETTQKLQDKQDMRDAYIKNVQNDPHISSETKQELLHDFYNRSKTEQNETAYLALNRLINPDKVKALHEPLGASTWDIITNPFDAYKASIVYGDYSQLPRHYNEAKIAGINMTPRSYQERFSYGQDGQGGSNLVGNVLNWNTNLLDAGDKVYRYARKGDKLNATLNLLRFAPLAGTSWGGKTLSYLDEVGEATDMILNKTPLNRFTQNSSSPLLQATGKALSPGNILKSKGIVSGMTNLPNLTNAGFKYYQSGSNEDFKNFANQSLKTAALLAPLGGSRLLKHIDPYRTAYFGVDAGLNLLKVKKPEEGIQYLPSLLKTFNVRKEGGTIETELTDVEIQDLLNEGYIIEELD